MIGKLVLAGLAVLAAVAAVSAVALYTPDLPRPALEARWAGPPSTFLDVAGLRVHLRDTGPREAAAIVFLHGFGSSLHTWDDWAADLERDHRVIRFDLPGFGLTGADPTGDYTDDRAVVVLLALFDRLGLQRASVVGHSLGGRIAWEFAAAHGDRVAKLVLVSPDGFASPGLSYDVPPHVPLLLRALPFVLPDAMLRGSLRAAYADGAVLTPPLYDRYRDLVLAPGVRRAVVARTGQHVLHDPVPRLRRITAPTLLLWGEADRMIPVSNAAAYEAALPNATLAKLPGVGHVPQEEAPGTVSIVRAFLDR